MTYIRATMPANPEIPVPTPTLPESLHTTILKETAFNDIIIYKIKKATVQTTADRAVISPR